MLGFDGPLHHLASAGGVEREHLDGERGDGLDGLGDGVGDVVELEVEEDVEAEVGDLADAVGPQAVNISRPTLTQRTVPWSWRRAGATERGDWASRTRMRSVAIVGAETDGDAGHKSKTKNAAGSWRGWRCLLAG